MSKDPSHTHSACCDTKNDRHTAAQVHEHDHDHDDGNAVQAPWRAYLPALFSLFMLLTGIGSGYLFPDLLKGYLRFFWYLLAYLPVGLPVMKEAWEGFRKKDFFTEFTLMSLATLGAFVIGEYPEGVAVMVFYAVGELFQSAAVRKAKGNIKALLDVRPSSAQVLRRNRYETVAPELVEIGEKVQVRPGEKIPLDGILLSPRGSFDTAALTGESKPHTVHKDGQVLAGMLNLDQVIELEVSRKFSDSSLARILDMVQNASARKAKTELLIRRFARIYTPIVFFLALACVIIPYFILNDYQFSDWLYRALVFLVISCPCALVISIPLGYFGGIGAASRKGILFKGSVFLDLITKVNTVVMDKTGTLTKGVFRVQEIAAKGMVEEEMMQLLAALESKSTHPVAKAITAYVQSPAEPLPVSDIRELAGMGLQGRVAGKEVLAGNTRLLDHFGISYDATIHDIVESIVVVAVNGVYAGYVLIADELKEDAGEALKALRSSGVTKIVMLSGDKDSITQKVAAALGIDLAYGGLMPEHKVQILEKLKQEPGRIVAFAGDGINDTPALALSDVGIAMGAMGSDAAIETADVIIQTDQPSKIATAIGIGKATRRVIIQNISLAFVVKALVLVLGAGGLATMWEAVFADVGVALLAILNAVRLQYMRT